MASRALSGYQDIEVRFALAGHPAKLLLNDAH